MFSLLRHCFNYMKRLTLLHIKRPDMSDKRILPVITLIIGLLLPTVLSAQVPVEVSNERMVSGGKVFFMHNVQKGQTLYSISRAYKVSIDVITRENVIPPSGIQTGQVLRIPFSADISEAPSRPSQATPPSQRPAAASTSSAAATAPATPAALPAVDPATGIRLARERIMYNGKPYYMHEVLKGQTLYSIARAYRVTILDIDRENAIPAGGLQAGQVLRIPAISSLTVQEEVTPPSGNVTDQPAPASQPKSAVTAATTTRPADAQTSRVNEPAVGVRSQTEANPPAAEATRSDVPARQSEPEKQATQPDRQAENASQATQPSRQAEPAAQTPAPVREPAAKKPQPEKKKIHKVQKGESLADIARKYNITVQELKQANKGVIFAMPDMRLVIPVKDDSDQ